MSRLIIKNLPKKIKEERIRSIFAGKGELTDVKLCYTKDGKFRRFCFVGYKTEEQAKAALHYFDDSFIDTSKIKVDIAKDLGDKSIPRPWSKYSERSSTYERRKKKDEERNSRMKQLKETKKYSKKDGLDTHSSPVAKVKKSIKALDDLEHDVEFQEFLNVHKHRRSKQTWSNDNTENIVEANKERKSTGTKKKTKREKMHKGELSAVHCDDSDESGNEDEVYDASEILGQKDKEIETKNNKDQEMVAMDCNLSDMAYLKTKIANGLQTYNVHRASSKTKNINSGLNEQENKKEQSSVDSENSVSEDDNDDDDDDGSGSNKNGSLDLEMDENGSGHEEPEESSVNGTIKMRGLPFKAKEQDIRDFFAPLRVINIRMMSNVKGKPTGCAFVDFSNKTDLQAALKRDHDCIEGRYIELFKDEGEKVPQRETEDKPWVKRLSAQGNDEQFESIAECGRLFLRNLAYTCCEEDLQQLFERFGPLSETYLPLDKATNKPIGLGFVTFLMPEHAVKAFNEMDGKVFQGRLLHILPSKAKETKSKVKDTTSAQYKAKRDMKRKSLSSSNHNWNTLFLGMNAVADIMANRYNTSKGDILDDASSSSLAVRMALGETQVVTETRKFLESQGVKLDVFGQPSVRRSQTVMVVKNLPYNTSCEELQALFAPFGSLSRIILPPAGITALVEFCEQSEAKRAFQKLAYSKFKHVPLYLEWAPVEVFSGNPLDSTTNQTETADNTKQVESEETIKRNETTDQGEENSNSEDSEGTTVFVKNLNFSTSEVALKEVFSKFGSILSVTIAKKRDPNQPGNLLSMGYGFVEFKKQADALQTIKLLQNSLLEGHTLQLKMSHRKPSENLSRRKSASLKIQKSSKILVRNVPFEATKRELQELFSTFGEIKTLRIPQKMSGTSSHRGFAFVDFLTKQDAKRAFESLCSSTHLYGRRLVLEWAEDEDSVDALRKRTADHFHGTPKTAKKKKDLQDDLMDTEMVE